MRSRSRSRRASTPTLGATIATTRMRLRCKPVWIEIVGRPGKIVVHAVETHTKQMLDLICCTPPVPAGWLVGASDRSQARDGYDIVVLINGSGLSQLAHRRAWHGLTM